jgi:hypothetical protein
MYKDMGWFAKKDFNAVVEEKYVDVMERMLKEIVGG